MWEKLLLSVVATFCIYLFLNLGNSSTSSQFLGRNLTNASHFIFNIPLLSR